MIEIQLQRKLESLLRLVNHPVNDITECIEFQLPPCYSKLEVMNSRLVLTSYVKTCDKSGLRKLLSRCHPQLTQGVGHRVFFITDSLYIICDLPLWRDHYFWYQQIAWQQSNLKKLAVI